MSEGADPLEAIHQRLVSGDAAALGQLFELFHERLSTMVRFRMDPRLCGRVDVEDVLQEAFLDAQKRFEHYPRDNEMPPYLWIRTIVTQTLIDVHRRHLGTQIRNVKREVSLHRPSYANTTSGSIAAHLIGMQTSPSQAAMRSELGEQLEQAIGQMSETDQEILALRHFEELTNNEVAEVLGLSAKAASIRYVRALGRLKEILKQIPGMNDTTHVFPTPDLPGA